MASSWGRDAGIWCAVMVASFSLVVLPVLQGGGNVGLLLAFVIAQLCDVIYMQIIVVANMWGMMMLRKILLAVLLLLAACQAYAQNAPVKAFPLSSLPLPQLTEQPIELRVAHVINPRLPRMSEAQIALMLEAMAKATYEHFGISVRFAQPAQIPIAQAFAGIPTKFAELAKRDQYNFQSWFALKSRLASAYARGLAQAGEPLEDMALFAQKNDIKLDARNFETFGKDAALFQLDRMNQWLKLKAEDGKSVINEQPFHEYTMWNHLGHGHMPYELVITNQIIASIEYIQPTIHTVIRGGYTNGITSYNPQSRFRSFSVWSTFAFTSNDADWLSKREGESYSTDEAARLAGLAAVHELGHQLLHLIHPFGQKGCIMDPVPMFAYRAWSTRLSAKDCPLRSSAAMTPGAYRFTYMRP